MTSPTPRRSITGIVERAIAGGRHRIDIAADGKITILPLGVTPANADAVALDAEIMGLIDGHGDAAH